MSMPRVVLVDDHGLFRSGVRAELGRQVEVVGEADDVQPAIDLIGELLPDVVLLDVHLPGGGGQAVVQAVKASHPEVRFLALSASDAPEDVIAVIRAGARGYVTKTISTTELADAVRRVAAGDADDAELSRQQPLLHQPVERRHQLALGQIARRAEDDNNAWLCRLLKPDALS